MHQIDRHTKNMKWFQTTDIKIKTKFNKDVRQQIDWHIIILKLFGTSL